MNFTKSLVLGASSNFILGAIELGVNATYANEMGSLSKPLFTAGASIIGNLAAESIIFGKYHKFGRFIARASSQYAPGALNKIEAFVKYPVDFSFGKLSEDVYKRITQPSSQEPKPQLKIGVQVKD